MMDGVDQSSLSSAGVSSPSSESDSSSYRHRHRRRSDDRNRASTGQKHDAAATPQRRNSGIGGWTRNVVQPLNDTVDGGGSGERSSRPLPRRNSRSGLARSEMYRADEENNLRHSALTHARRLSGGRGLRDDDAGSVGHLSTGGLSLGLTSLGHGTTGGGSRASTDYLASEMGSSGSSSSSGISRSQDGDGDGDRGEVSDETLTSQSLGDGDDGKQDRKARGGKARGGGKNGGGSPSMKPVEVMGARGLMAKRRSERNQEEAVRQQQQQRRGPDSGRMNRRGSNKSHASGNHLTDSDESIKYGAPTVRSVGSLDCEGAAREPREGCFARRPSLDFSSGAPRIYRSEAEQRRNRARRGAEREFRRRNSNDGCDEGHQGEERRRSRSRDDGLRRRSRSSDGLSYPHDHYEEQDRPRRMERRPSLTSMHHTSDFEVPNMGRPMSSNDRLHHQDHAYYHDEAQRRYQEKLRDHDHQGGRMERSRKHSMGSRQGSSSGLSSVDLRAHNSGHHAHSSARNAGPGILPSTRSINSSSVLSTAENSSVPPITEIKTKKRRSPFRRLGGGLYRFPGSGSSKVADASAGKTESVAPPRRFGKYRRICFAVVAASAVTIGIVAAVLPDDVGGPMGSIKGAGSKTKEFFRTIVYTEEIEVALPTSGTKRTSSDPAASAAAAEATGSARKSAPSLAKGDDRSSSLPDGYYGYGGGGGGNRRDESTLAGYDNDLEFETNGGFMITGGVSGSMTSSSQLRGRNHHRNGYNRHSRRDEERFPAPRGMDHEGRTPPNGGMRDLENLHSVGPDAGGGLDGSGRQYHRAVAEVDELPHLDLFNTADGPDKPGIRIPRSSSTNFVDVWDLPTPQSTTLLASNPHVALLWAVPHSGFEPVRDVFARCLNMVRADELPREKGLALPSSQASGPLAALIHPLDGTSVVNVDLSSPMGLDRGARLGLVHSGLIDLVVAHGPNLHPSSALFGDKGRRVEGGGRGRVLGVFRHPVRRAAAEFAALERTDDPRILTMNLLAYSRSELVNENAVVRALTGDVGEGEGAGPITPRHVEVAKEVLRRKVLVGLADDGADGARQLAESLERFERYLGRFDSIAHGGDAAQCQGERLTLAEMKGSEDRAPVVNPESEEYAELARRNWADVQLYHYAKGLYKEQAALIP